MSMVNPPRSEIKKGLLTEVQTRFHTFECDPQTETFLFPPPRVYRQGSFADSYTLSRPPGRAQPIRIQSEGQPIRTQRRPDNISNNNRYFDDITYSRSPPRSQGHQNGGIYRHSSGSQYRVEAPLEPRRTTPASPSRPPISPRTHVKDIQFGHQAKAQSAVEISPVAPGHDGVNSDDWQESSLYVRRPSPEDLQRVTSAGSQHTSSQTTTSQVVSSSSTVNGSHDGQLTSGTAVRHSTGFSSNSHQLNGVVRVSTSRPMVNGGGSIPRITRVTHQQHTAGGRPIITHPQVLSPNKPRQIPSASDPGVISISAPQYINIRESPRDPPMITISNPQYTSVRETQFPSNGSGSLMSGSDRKYTVRTTIPREPPLSVHAMPMLKINEEAMHF